MELSLDSIRRLRKSSLAAQIRATDLYEEMYVTKQGVIRQLFMNKEDRRRYKLARQTLMGAQELAKSESKQLSLQKKRACTFDFIKANEFLARVISIIEHDDEDYVAEFITVSNVSNSSVKKYCLIAKPKQVHTIKGENFFGEIKSSRDIEVILDREDSKYILSELKSPECTHQLASPDIISVERELIRSFPYLQDVVLGLIEERLTNPSLSEEELYNAYSQKVSENVGTLRTNILRKESNSTKRSA